MTKLIPLSRAAAQAAAALGACLLALACPPAASAAQTATVAAAQPATAATTPAGAATAQTTAATTATTPAGTAMRTPAATTATTPAGTTAATGTSTAKTATGENTPLNLNPSTPAAHASSGGASIVRTIVGLAIVIGVILGLTWILRQVKSGRDPHASSAGLASVAALTLGSGRSVHLVRAGSDYVLLGSGEHGLVPIHRYTEAQAREAGLPTLDEPPPRARRSLLGGPAGSEARLAGSGARLAGSEARRAGSETRTSDPMRMPSPSSGIVERVREWTVRR
jgi:flagellar protein FliO/FliZ